MSEPSRAILANYHYLDEEKAKKIEDILEDALTYIGQMVFECNSGQSGSRPRGAESKKELIDLNGLWIALIAAPSPNALRANI